MGARWSFGRSVVPFSDQNIWAALSCDQEFPLNPKMAIVGLHALTSHLGGVDAFSGVPKKGVTSPPLFGPSGTPFKAQMWVNPLLAGDFSRWAARRRLTMSS